jgi:hypothetical protein
MNILNPSLSLQEIIDATTRIIIYVATGFSLASGISFSSLVPDYMFLLPIMVMALMIGSLLGAVIADHIFDVWEKKYYKYRK